MSRSDTEPERKPRLQTWDADERSPVRDDVVTF